MGRNIYKKSTFNSLESLDLSQNKLQDSKRILCKLLSYNVSSVSLRSLKEVKLANNSITGIALACLCEVLSDPRCRIQKLDLSGQQSMTYVDSIPLSQMLMRNRSLIELDLSSNYQMLTKGLLLIFFALHTNSSLKVLRCNDTVIYHELLEALAALLLVNHCLTEIWMLNSNIDKFLAPAKYGII